MKLYKHTVFPAALLAALLTWNAAPATADGEITVIEED